MNLDDIFPLRYISSLSKAKFKVGKKSDVDEFIGENGWERGIAWLEDKVDNFFPDCETKLVVVTGGDDPEVLALELTGSMPASRFRDAMHSFGKAMRIAGHRDLYLAM